MRFHRCYLVPFSAILLLACWAGARTLDPDQVWRRVRRTMYPERYSMTMEVSVEGESGQQFRVRLDQDGRERHRIEFLAPETQRGKVIVHSGQELHLYLPNLGRSMKVSPRQVLAAGGMVFEDLADLGSLPEYDPAEGTEEGGRYRLVLTARRRRAAYRRVELEVDPTTWLPERITYHLPSGSPGKRLTLTETRETEDGPRPAEFLLENLITRTRSRLRILEVQEVLTFPETTFQPPVPPAASPAPDPIPPKEEVP